jgi:hypothetical protein
LVPSSEFDPYEYIATQLKHELSAVKSLGVSFRSIALDPADPENGAECVLGEPVLVTLGVEGEGQDPHLLAEQALVQRFFSADVSRCSFAADQK